MKKKSEMVDVCTRDPDLLLLVIAGSGWFWLTLAGFGLRIAYPNRDGFHNGGLVAGKNVRLGHRALQIAV